MRGLLVLIMVMILTGCASKPPVKPIKPVNSHWNEWPRPQQREWQKCKKKGIPYYNDSNL